MASSNSYQSIAIADFNGDGKLDLAFPVAVPQVGYSALAVMLGNGDGTFQAPIVANPGPFPTPGPVQAADFNGDGKMDLAFSTGTQGISVFLGNGDGTFQSPKTTTLNIGVSPFVVEDFTGDGKLDLAFVGGATYVAVGNGDGTFQTAVIVSNGASSGSGAPLAVDFNGDGILDLVVPGANTGGSSGPVSVVLGVGGGKFQSPSSVAGVPGRSVTVVDLDGDGKLDLATATTDSASSTFGIASVAFGNGDGTFQFDTVISTLIGRQIPSYLIAADFNGDGRTDLLETIVNATFGPQSFAVLSSKGDGTFQAPILTSVSACGPYVFGSGICAAATGDLNGDSKLDVVATSPDTGSVGVFLGNGDGTFKSEVGYGGSGSSVALGDFNGDGALDIVTSGGSANNVSLLLGNGDGTFGFPAVIPLGSPANFVTVADFNHDGHLDLAIATGTSVAILLGNGDGTFGTEVDYPAIAGSVVVVGDFNGDGKLDLATASSSSNNVSVLLGNGDGTFGLAANYAVLSGAYFLAVGDLNGDGKTDLAVLNGPDVSILVGNGDGTFQAAANFGTQGGGSGLATADFNGDGSPDIAVPGVSLLFNRPLGPAVSLSPRALNFGNQGVGNKNSQNLTLHNNGRQPVTISSIEITGGQSSDFGQTNTCNGSVGTGASCTISVTFIPASTGPRSAVLSIADNAPGSPQTVALTGTGVSLALTTSGSSSATVLAGQTAKYGLSIGGGGFGGTATLSCTGAPAGATCSLPASINVSPITASPFTVSVSTAARAMAAMPSGHTPVLWLWATAILGLAVLPGTRSTNRSALRVARALPWMLLVLLCACGGSSGGANSSGTPAGTYTLTVKATSGSVSQSVTLKLTVR